MKVREKGEGKKKGGGPKFEEQVYNATQSPKKTGGKKLEESCGVWGRVGGSGEPG